MDYQVQNDVHSICEILICSLDNNKTIENIFQEIDHEYGVSKYGTNKYSNNTMHWIGYIYRYMAYTYELSSKTIYKMIKPKELKEVYRNWHLFINYVFFSIQECM